MKSFLANGDSGGIYSADNTTTPYDPIFALHPYDPAAQMYRAPYRMYDPDSARWTRRDPLGMVDGPNMYAYVGGGLSGGGMRRVKEYTGLVIPPTRTLDADQAPALPHTLHRDYPLVV